MYNKLITTLMVANMPINQIESSVIDTTAKAGNVASELEPLSFFCPSKKLSLEENMTIFFEILYRNKHNKCDLNALDSHTISRTPDYVPSFYFIFKGERCEPTISRTEWSYDGKKYTDLHILLGNGSSKSVMEIGDEAIFLPRVNNPEMWARMVDEEITVSQKIEQFELGLHTQSLSKSTITIVDKFDETRRATIPIMVGPSFNHLGKKNNSYIYDTKNNKIYGTHIPLFDNKASNLNNVEWYAALFKPLINELALCLALQIPCSGDSGSILVKNDIDSPNPPSCHLMLYDFSYKHKERDFAIIGRKKIPSTEDLIGISKDLINYLQTSISRKECAELGIEYGWSNNHMQTFISENNLLSLWVGEALVYAKTTLHLDDGIDLQGPTECFSLQP